MPNSLAISPALKYPLLTTKGDMIVQADTDPERLASSVLGDVLQSLGLEEVPAWGKHKIKHGGIAHKGFQISTTTTTEIRGIGFEPSIILFIAGHLTSALRCWSIGFSLNISPIKNMCLWYSDPSEVKDMVTRSARCRVQFNDYVETSVTAFVADGFDINTVRVGGVAVGNIQTFSIA